VEEIKEPEPPAEPPVDPEIERIRKIDEEIKAFGPVRH